MTGRPVFSRVMALAQTSVGRLGVFDNAARVTSSAYPLLYLCTLHELHCAFRRWVLGSVECLPAS